MQHILQNLSTSDKHCFLCQNLHGGRGGGGGQTGEGVLENTPYIEVDLNIDGACVLTRCYLN